MSFNAYIDVVNTSFSNYFTNTSNNDVVVYTDTSNQSIHLGTRLGAAPSMLKVTRSNVELNGDIALTQGVNITGLSISKRATAGTMQNVTSTVTSVPSLASNVGNVALSLGSGQSNFSFRNSNNTEIGKIDEQGSLVLLNGNAILFQPIITSNVLINSPMVSPTNFTTMTFANQGSSTPLYNYEVGSRSHNFIVTRSKSDYKSKFYYYMRIQRNSWNYTDWTYPVSLVIPATTVTSLSWGSASPTYSNLTLSFWARSSVTGSHWITIMNASGPAGAGIAYYTTFNVASVNTWQFFSITIPAPGNVGAFTSMCIGFLYCMPTSTGIATGGVLLPNAWTSVSTSKTGYPSSAYISSLATYYALSTNTFDIAAPLLVPGTATAAYPDYYLYARYLDDASTITASVY